MMTSVVSNEGGPDRSVGTRLYAASRYHASKARALVDATSEHERLDAATHAGAALEFIAKAVLAEVDVRLLPDREAHHTLLDSIARDREGHVPHRVSIRTTIGASLAIGLVARLVPACRQHIAAVKRVLSVRNAAVHMAEAPTTAALADAITAMQAFGDAAATELRGSSRDYWGVDFDEVQRQRAEVEAGIVAGANAKVDQARDRYTEMVGPLVGDLRERVLTALRLRSSTSGDAVDEVTCPACRETATVTWEWDADVEEEFPGEYTYSSFLALAGLLCPVCGLSLDATEMLALGIDPELPELDPADDFEPYDD